MFANACNCLQFSYSSLKLLAATNVMFKPLFKACEHFILNLLAVQRCFQLKAACSMCISVIIDMLAVEINNSKQHMFGSNHDNQQVSISFLLLAAACIR